jgi:hypothetical protein
MDSYEIFDDLGAAIASSKPTQELIVEIVYLDEEVKKTFLMMVQDPIEVKFSETETVGDVGKDEERIRQVVLEIQQSVGWEFSKAEILIALAEAVNNEIQGL